MSHPLRLAWLPLVASVLIAGCASAPQKPKPEVAQSAETAVAEGNLVFAAQEYERLAKANRKQREHYILLAAEAWRDEGEFGEVRRVLAELKRKRLTAAQNLQLDLLLAEGLLLDGKFDEADALLTLPEDALVAGERVRYLELKAKALGGKGRIIDAVTVRSTLQMLLPARERADNQSVVMALLATATPEVLHAELRGLSSADLRRPWFEKSLRDRSLVPARAPLRASHAVGTWLPDGDGTLHAEGYADPGKIALLLPLTGEFAMAGKAIRDGFLAAWFASAHRPGEQVHVYDTGNDRSSLSVAVKTAIEEGAASLVGPLERDQVEALFGDLPEGVRVLALNHSDASPVPPSGHFQFGLAPEEEAALAAERLIDQGVQRAAVLISQEDWAERASKAFAAQFMALGGVVMGERSIAPAAVKFTEELDALLGAPSSEPAPTQTQESSLDNKDDTSTPDKPAARSGLRAEGPQALFAAIRNAQGRMLMPQLRVRSQDGLIVLATSHIATGSSIASADPDMEGASFLDAPFLFDSNTTLGVSRNQLGNELPAANASPRLFAFGVDACRLLPFLDYLRHNEGAYLEGASGQLLVDAFGRVRRISSGYRFSGGVPILSESLVPASGMRIEPALESAQ